jgi:hypothetical protein
LRMLDYRNMLSYTWKTGVNYHMAPCVQLMLIITIIYCYN